ncbi:MAG: hypothetical protein GX180_12590 [Enterococcus sp.]|nr:hypothetical protein [Enterococcus sp.]
MVVFLKKSFRTTGTSAFSFVDKVTAILDSSSIAVTLSIDTRVIITRLPLTLQCEYCGRFLPVVQFFLPHFAEEFTTLCG